MISSYGSGRGRRRSSCSSASIYWTAIVALACVAGGALYCLQGAYKELASLKESVEVTGTPMHSSSGDTSAETHRRELAEQLDAQKQDLARLDSKTGFEHKRLQARAAAKERDAVQLAEAETKAKLAEAKKDVTGLSEVNTKLTSAEGKLAAAEKEVKEVHLPQLEITVKAGACQQQFAALNAECATLKQGLANLGLSSQTVVPADKQSALPKADALDPRGGIEAAKVLKDASQQPWKDDGEGSSSEGITAQKAVQGASSRVQVQQPQLLHDGESDRAGTDVDETGPGLEKALVQGGVV